MVTVSDPLPFKKIYRYPGGLGYGVFYSGRATVFGTASQGEVGSILEGNICFDVLGPTAAKIPRLKDDDRSAWFCFPNTLSNADLQRLNEATSGITIEVRDYFENTRPTEVWDTAKFVRILE